MGKKASQQARISAIVLLTAGILTGIVALLAQTASFMTAKTILAMLSLVLLLGSVFYFVRSRVARKSEQTRICLRMNDNFICKITLASKPMKQLRILVREESGRG